MNELLRVVDAGFPWSCRRGLTHATRKASPHHTTAVRGSGNKRAGGESVLCSHTGREAEPRMRFMAAESRGVNFRIRLLWKQEEMGREPFWIMSHWMWSWFFLQGVVSFTRRFLFKRLNDKIFLRYEICICLLTNACDPLASWDVWVRCM